MSGLMNNYIYGKAGQADYTLESMPKNRWELFFTSLKQQFGKLVELNLVYDLFCLPLFFWIWLNYSMLNQYVEAGDVTGFMNGGYLMMFCWGMIPCMMIMGIGSSGQMYILRNWSRDQHAFMLSDFKDALKSGWKSGLLLGLINGLVFPLVFIGYEYYGMMAQQAGMFFMVPQVLMVVLAVVWNMMNMLNFPMLVSYEMRLRDIIRNSALMAVARLPWSVLFILLTIAVPVALLLFVPYGILIVPLYFIVIGFSVTGLIYSSYANSCFDKYLNPRIEGAKVGQGMRDPALDFVDEEEEAEIREEVNKLK